MVKSSSKSSKKHKKRSRRQETSSSEDEWVEADTARNRREHARNESPDDLMKRKKRRRHSNSDSQSHSRVERTSRTCHASEQPNKSPKQENTKRDDWMNLPTNFASFSNVDKKKNREEERKNQREKDVYDPSKCPRELNVYWKNGGDGLPKFQKPSEDTHSYKSHRPSSSGQSRWRKSKPETVDRRIDGPSETSSRNSAGPSKTVGKLEQDVVDTSITEKALNLLAGKLVKAEIMGNKKLAEELKQRLDAGRRALAEERTQGEEVMLTEANRQGASKPLELRSAVESGKRRKKAVETHFGNERVKYFADDDKYSLKQMFENEKFGSANDQDSAFMKIASNIKKNDDLDDLFADDVRRKRSDAKLADAKRSQAISEHKKVSTSLENCLRCIQSTVMQKHLIVAMGEYVYLALPAHEPLVEGHCLIAPIRHVASVTQMDENEWNEMNDFRKALSRMYEAKQQEVMFFEIAVGFHKYPHTVLECVPLDKEEAGMAPMYFKKAIDESEIEWTQNKKLVPLKNRDVRQAIPKQLPYFAINFGTSDGFAHVIEDEKLFPKNFAQEIIGGMLDLDHSKWRRPARDRFEVQSKRTVAFYKVWSNFDCTAKAM